jgi:hypothetical protein
MGKKSGSLSFVAVFGSGIRDPGWVKIGIRDKLPGSATLIPCKFFACIKFYVVLIPKFKFCEEKVLWSSWNFLKLKSLIRKEMAQNFEISVLLKCFRMLINIL